MQDRYSRHNLYFEMIGNNNFNFLNSKTITLVGAGGIGTNIALLLTVAGIKKIYLVDDDIVELSNLTRQYIFSEKEVGQKKGKVLKKTVTKTKS
jgi:molybdopterin-synthase adenylyltransferase